MPAERYKAIPSGDTQFDHRHRFVSQSPGFLRSVIHAPCIGRTGHGTRTQTRHVGSDRPASKKLAKRERSEGNGTCGNIHKRVYKAHSHPLRVHSSDLRISGVTADTTSHKS